MAKTISLYKIDPPIKITYSGTFKYKNNSIPEIKGVWIGTLNSGIFTGMFKNNLKETDSIYDGVWTGQWDDNNEKYTGKWTSSVQQKESTALRTYPSSTIDETIMGKWTYSEIRIEGTMGNKKVIFIKKKNKLLWTTDEKPPGTGEIKNRNNDLYWSTEDSPIDTMRKKMSTRREVVGYEKDDDDDNSSSDDELFRSKGGRIKHNTIKKYSVIKIL